MEIRSLLVTDGSIVLKCWIYLLLTVVFVWNTVSRVSILTVFLVSTSSQPNKDYNNKISDEYITQTKYQMNRLQ